MKNRHFNIKNKECLCDHGLLNTTKERKDKYIPENLYKHMKGTLIKYWNRKIILGLHSSDHYPELTTYDISEGNIKCK